MSALTYSVNAGCEACMAHMTGWLTDCPARTRRSDTGLLVGCGKKLKIMRKFLAKLCVNVR